MSVIKNFNKIFSYMCNHPQLAGTFAGHFYHDYKLMDDPEKKYIHNDQQLLISYKVPKHICNFNGFVHGGAYATIVDTATTLAILKLDSQLRKSATIELTESCMYPAKAGDNLIIRAECLRIGQQIAFTECKIMLEGTNKMVVSGRHTKILQSESWDNNMFQLMEKGEISQ